MTSDADHQNCLTVCREYPFPYDEDDIQSANIKRDDQIVFKNVSYTDKLCEV